jgi:hypothetical protein
LIARVNSPIRFIPPQGGNPADGYEATILPDICAVLIDAHQQGKLGKYREHLATRAAILQHGFATVGIIALVDYQDFRQRDALARILEKFVAKELRPWVKTFPSDFYKQIYRLNNWPYTENAGRPVAVSSVVKWSQRYRGARQDRQILQAGAGTASRLHQGADQPNAASDAAQAEG